MKKSEAARRAAEQLQADEFTVSRLVESWASIKLREASASYRAEGPRSIKRLLGELADRPVAFITTAKLQVIIDREIDRVPALTIDARASGRGMELGDETRPGRL
jgi:hypothetical protein